MPGSAPFELERADPRPSSVWCRIRLGSITDFRLPTSLPPSVVCVPGGEMGLADLAVVCEHAPTALGAGPTGRFL